MAEAGEVETTEKKPDTKSGLDDAAYAREEAKKAFADRDKYKKELRELRESGRLISDEQAAKYKELEDAAAKAEEERAKKAGEFDSLKKQLADKHAAELDAERKKAEAVSSRFKQTVVKAEFGAASDLFGGADAKTILDVELAIAALGKYVTVEDADDDPRGYKIVVKAPNGQPVLGRDGNPAPFADAISEVINLLPNKDRILRGSGKTGSGSSGGSGGTSPTTDLAELTQRARKGDKAALAALSQQQSGLGGIRMGEGAKKAS
jgi:hypothetical protein